MMPSAQYLARCYDDAYLHWLLVQSNEELVYQEDVRNNNSSHNWMPKSHQVLCDWLAESKKVLDIGCGIDQSMQHYFSEDGYVGLDPLPQMRESERLVLKGMAEFVPFASRSFDTVLMHSSFDHVIDSYRSLAEIVRVLDDFGRLILTQCIYFPPELGGHRRLWREPRDPWHFRWMTQESVVSIVEGSGLVIEKSTVVIPDTPTNWGVILLRAQKLPFRGLPFTNIGSRHPKQTPPLYPRRTEPWKVLIFGASAAGNRFLGRVGESPLIDPVGFVDNNPSLNGQSINGLPVAGASQIQGLQWDSIVICSGPGREQITEQLKKMGYVHLVHFFTDEEFIVRMQGNFTERVVSI